MFLTQLPLEHFHLSLWLPEKWDSLCLDRQSCTFTTCPDFGEFAWLFPGKKNPHLFFRLREEKDHSSPPALAVFQVLLEHVGLLPMQCSFLGLHKLHPYHPSLIHALNSGTNMWGQCDPTAPWGGAWDRQHILLSLPHTCGRNFVP